MDSQQKIKPYVIGLDLGGTNAVFGIVDSHGYIKASTAIKTQAYANAEDFVRSSAEALQVIIEQVGGIATIKGMGIGAPNANYYSGTIERAANIAWAKGVVPLAAMFSEALGIPVALTNDAKAAALGEMTYGVAKGMKNFIMLTLGTGVGSGIVVNGQLVYGSDGFAGELGHVIMVREGGRPCGCGRSGCLEAYCSATGVARTAREMLSGSDRPSLLRELDADKITSLDISIAAGKGDIGPNRIGALPGKTVRQLLRRGRGGFGLAYVAEVPGHARHVGETVERETDLLHPGGEVVAHDHAGLRVVHGDRARQLAHRPGERREDRLDDILSGRSVGMFHGFRGLCRGGFAVAEHPQHAAERRDVTVEREGHGLVHRRGGGLPADAGRDQ